MMEKGASLCVKASQILILVGTGWGTAPGGRTVSSPEERKVLSGEKGGAERGEKRNRDFTFRREDVFPGLFFDLKKREGQGFPDPERKEVKNLLRAIVQEAAIQGGVPGKLGGRETRPAVGALLLLDYYFIPLYEVRK